MKYITLNIIILISINFNTATIKTVDLEKRFNLLKTLAGNCIHINVYVPDVNEIPYNENFYDLDTLLNTRPEGYITRVTFYVQGGKQSRILLSPTNTYKVASDPVYEFLLFGNTESTIRRKVLGSSMTTVTHSPLLDPFEPIRFTIEVTEDGHVGLYKNDEKLPFISGYDSSPTPVKYLSFASRDGTIEYYFNCTKTNQNDTENIGDLYLNKVNSLQMVPVTSNLLDDAINQCNEIKNMSEVKVKGCLLLIPSDDFNKDIKT